MKTKKIFVILFSIIVVGLIVFACTRIQSTPSPKPTNDTTRTVNNDSIPPVGGGGGGGTPPTPLADVMQVFVTQSCSGGATGGIMFKVHPFTPYSDLSLYEIIFEKYTNCPMTQIDSQTVLFHNNLNHPDFNFQQEHVRVRITIKCSGYPNLVLSEADIWSSTCNHDNDPLDCGVNNALLTMPKYKFSMNEAITATYQGNIHNGLYVAGNGCNASVSGQNVNFTATQSQFNFHVQPTNNGGCHGWTKFFGQL